MPYFYNNDHSVSATPDYNCGAAPSYNMDAYGARPNYGLQQQSIRLSAEQREQLANDPNAEIVIKKKQKKLPLNDLKQPTKKKKC